MSNENVEDNTQPGLTVPEDNDAKKAARSRWHAGGGSALEIEHDEQTTEQTAEQPEPEPQLDHNGIRQLP